jgi:hypothetical protein
LWANLRISYPHRHPPILRGRVKEAALTRQLHVRMSTPVSHTQSDALLRSGCHGACSSLVPDGRTPPPWLPCFPLSWTNDASSVISLRCDRVSDRPPTNACKGETSKYLCSWSKRQGQGKNHSDRKAAVDAKVEEAAPAEMYVRLQWGWSTVFMWVITYISVAGANVFHHSAGHTSQLANPPKQPNSVCTNDYNSTTTSLAHLS